MEVLYGCVGLTTTVPHIYLVTPYVIMQDVSDSSEGGHIHRPAVRLPPFFSDRPGLWFAQAEAQFSLASVTSEKTKFNYVTSQLEYRHGAEIEDIIMKKMCSVWPRI